MKKVLVEFINTWPSCDSIGRNVEDAASKFGDLVEVKLYRVGKDVDYIKKYGMIFTGTMIINENKRVTRLSRKNIENEIRMAVDELAKSGE